MDLGNINFAENSHSFFREFENSYIFKIRSTVLNSYLRYFKIVKETIYLVTFRLWRCLSMYIVPSCSMVFQFYSMVANHWSNDGMVTMVFQKLYYPLVPMVFGPPTIAPNGFSMGFNGS